jgi:hypothetical protein
MSSRFLVACALLVSLTSIAKSADLPCGTPADCRLINSPFRPGAPGGGARTHVAPSNKTAAKNFGDSNARALSSPRNPDAPAAK